MYDTYHLPVLITTHPSASNSSIHLLPTLASLKGVAMINYSVVVFRKLGTCDGGIACKHEGPTTLNLFFAMDFVNMNCCPCLE